MKKSTTATAMNNPKEKTYTFGRLSEDAQQTVLDSLKNWLVDEGWWEYVYDSFEAICTSIGIEVDVDQIYFTGFWSQGDGAKFTASVNIHELIEGIKKKKYLEDYPGLQKKVRSFTPKDCTVSPRILDLIKRDWIDLTIAVDTNNRGYSSKTRVSWDYSYNECVNYKNIEGQMMNLESWIHDIVSELDNLLYRLLENEHNHLTSDKTIKEMIRNGKYRFSKEGEILSF